MTARVGVGPAIVGSSILWITTLAQAGFRKEILWIVLAALSFDHARCIWEFGATGTVDHALGNSGIEDRVTLQDISAITSSYTLINMYLFQFDYKKG